MIEMEVQKVLLNSRAYHCVLLKEKDGNLRLHIVVGPSEAGAISAAQKGYKPARPHSYDLACSLLSEANARIERVEITSLYEGIYYAEVHLKGADGDVTAIDSRPSDAIALALRSDAPIFAAREVLEEEEIADLAAFDDTAFAESGEECDVQEKSLDEADAAVDTVKESSSTALQDLLQKSGDGDPQLSAVDVLKRRLRQAISEEAYEEAAKLRDRIAAMDEQKG